MIEIEVIPESPIYSNQHNPKWYYLEEVRTSRSRTSSSGATRPIPCPSPRRTRTTAGSYDHVHRGTREPWEHMAQTYAWVLEQEIADMVRKNEETVRWVLEQQERDARERTMFTMQGVENRYRQMIYELAYDFQREASRLKAREEESKRKAMRWQKEVDKAVREELRRLQAKRREAERYRMAYDRRRAQEDTRERERQRVERERMKAHREKAEKAEKEAWKLYEERWSTLNSGTAPSDSEELTFQDIPWPMFPPPRKVEDITPARIAMFLLSPVHSEDLVRKDRLKHALRRWHPDRFGRALGKVADKDKPAVEEGAGIVARCLNNLMERES